MPNTVKITAASNFESLQLGRACVVQSQNRLNGLCSVLKRFAKTDPLELTGRAVDILKAIIIISRPGPVDPSTVVPSSVSAYSENQCST